MSHIIYNVTLNVNHAAADSWLKWMQEIHIPEVMGTGLFIENRILRLIGDEDSGGVTFAVQYTAASMELYHQYKEKYAPALQTAHSAKFKDQFVAFRTLLEVIQ